MNPPEITKRLSTCKFMRKFSTDAILAWYDTNAVSGGIHGTSNGVPAFRGTLVWILSLCKSQKERMKNQQVRLSHHTKEKKARQLHGGGCRTYWDRSTFHGISFQTAATIQLIKIAQ